MYSSRFDFKFESLNKVKIQLERWGFQPRECSRFLARHYPDLAANLINAIVDGLEELP
jgi:hypothetical protein